MNGFLMRSLGAVIIWLLPSASAIAQAKVDAYPMQSVRLILPFGPGSSTDMTARIISEKLQAKWGKSVFVENRPGGDGLLAINAFLAAADDHTLLYASTSSFILHPYTLPSKPPYNVDTDLLPIVRTSDSALTIAVSVGSGANSLTEWVALARADAGKFNAAGGAGVAELALRAFIKEQTLPVAFVPYRDIVQAGGDLAANRLQLLSSSLAVAQPHVDAGKVRVVATATSKRSPLAPKIPTAAEQGFPTIGYESTVGLYGPSTMSLALRERIAVDVINILSDAAVIKRIGDVGQAVFAEGPLKLDAIVKAQKKEMARLAVLLDMQLKQ